jgi:ribonuclease Z
MENIALWLTEVAGARAAQQIKKQGRRNGPAPNKLHKLIDSPELHVILIGTGTPLVVENRSGPCTAIVGAGHFFLIDVGPGAYRSCTFLGLPMGRLDAVILTHFHSDHIGDLGEVMTFSWVAGRTNVLPVYGPEGVESVVDGFNKAYALDMGYRRDHHAPYLTPSLHGLKPITLPYPVTPCGRIPVFSSSTHSGLFSIEAFEVDHFPVKPAYGFRVSLGKSVIAISGDTCKCESLLQNCMGAHVIVQEAMCCHFISSMAALNDKTGNDFNAKLMRDITDYHTSVQECVDIAALTRVPVMLLTHLVPAPDNFITEQVFFSRLSRPGQYRGAVTIGEDGMICKVTGDGQVKLVSPARKAKVNIVWLFYLVVVANAVVLMLNPSNSFLSSDLIAVFIMFLLGMGVHGLLTHNFYRVKCLAGGVML